MVNLKWAIFALVAFFLMAMLGTPYAYFPKNIVAGSYYANIITNFSGYGLTVANITVLSKINTTNPYFFYFNDSANGQSLNCTTPYLNGSFMDYYCFGHNESIRHNTILDLYGLLGNATNYISQNLSILSVTPQHQYYISTEVFLNGNVVVNESVASKMVNITDINSSQQSSVSGISLDCANEGPAYITGNLTLSFYPVNCYYNGAISSYAINSNSIISEAAISNVISNKVYNGIAYSNLSLKVYRPMNVSSKVPPGYSSFYSVGAHLYYGNGTVLPSIVKVQSVYQCNLPKGPLSGLEYYQNQSGYIRLYEYYKSGSNCYLDFYFPAWDNISIIQKLPANGKPLTTTTINTTTTTTIPQHHAYHPTTTTTSTTSTTTSTTTTTIKPTTTVPPTQPLNNNKNQEEKNTRDTAAVVVVITSASTTAIGSIRRSGKR